MAIHLKKKPINMRHYIKISLSFIFSLFLMASCNDTMSLEEYLVKNGKDKRFMAANLSSDVFLSGADLSKEDRQKISSIKKINFLAFKKDSTKTGYDSSKAQLKQILDDEEFKNLMNVNNQNSEVQLKYTGDDVNIDELIVFAESYEMGFMVARLLGDDMKPKDFYNLATMMDKLNFGEMEEFTKDIDLSNI
mgnify:CR=1 FL=1